MNARLAATLGTGGAVCGVSGAIAIGGAVGAKKEDVSVAISLVVVWAVVMIFVLPLAAKSLHLATGVAGAWIGTSRIRRCGRPRAAQNLRRLCRKRVRHFRQRRCVGRRIHVDEGDWTGRWWIGVWAFVLSLIATTRWERTGIQAEPAAAKSGGASEVRAGISDRLARRHGDRAGIRYAAYKKDVIPALVAPLQALRTWAFTFAFLSIGLTTRLREFAAVGARPFYDSPPASSSTSPWDISCRRRYSVIFGHGRPMTDRSMAVDSMADRSMAADAPACGNCRHFSTHHPPSSPRCRIVELEFRVCLGARGRWRVQPARSIYCGRKPVRPSCRPAVHSGATSTRQS